ncbi:MAG: maleylpyruvate isomerase N-terminal domain-containing protein [Chloroflexi bacterium]|nr:maleylpyruvate isomerase N-terminal domain-containing protein [Chloroflexota bacterium]
MPTEEGFATWAIKTGQLELGRMLATLRAIPAAGWSRPSACEGWSVPTVVAHLGLIPSFFLKTWELGQAAEPVPFLGHSDVREFRSVRGARTAELAAGPRDELIAWFEREWRGLYDAVNRFGPADFQRRGWHPISIWTIERFLGMAVFEIAIHHWDVRAPADAGADFDSDVQQLLVQFLSRWPDLLVRDRDLDCGPTSVRFDFGGVAPSVAITIDERGKMVRGAADAQATIHSTPTSFILVGTGRRKPTDLPSGAWRVTGDAAAVDRFTSCLIGL